MTIDNAKMNSHSSGGSSSSTSMSSSGGSAGGSSSASSRMGSKRSNAGGSLSNNNNNNGELDLENLEYPDSPTSHKWFADNSDLSPLTVLDNINLKTEFPYSTGNIELDKPPDINSITLDSGAENLFQFAASVPNVPDNSSTFLDIGADTFSQSLYDDLGDINMSDFPNVGAFTTAISETVIESPVFTTAPVSTNTTALTSMTFPTASMVTTAGQVILTKPVTLEKLEPTSVATNQQGIYNSIFTLKTLPKNSKFSKKFYKKKSFVIDFDTKKYLASFNTNLILTHEFLVALMDAIITLGKFNFHQNFP